MGFKNNQTDEDACQSNFNHVREDIDKQLNNRLLGSVGLKLHKIYYDHYQTGNPERLIQMEEVIPKEIQDLIQIWQPPSSKARIKKHRRIFKDQKQVKMIDKIAKAIEKEKFSDSDDEETTTRKIQDEIQARIDDAEEKMKASHRTETSQLEDLLCQRQADATAHEKQTGKKVSVYI